MLNEDGNENGINRSNNQKKNKNKFARAGSFLSFFTVVLRNCNAVL